MRYLSVLLCLSAVGAVAMVHCTWDPNVGDCDPESCAGVNCDDGNECTYEYCYCGGCLGPFNWEDGTACTFDGMAGVCVDGVCGKNLCEDIECDDGLECTEDACDYADGTCDFLNLCDDLDECTQDVCDPTDGMCRFPPGEDGMGCMLLGLYGTCEGGVCVGVCDPASEEVTECPILEGLFCCPGDEGCDTNCN